MSDDYDLSELGYDDGTLAPLWELVDATTEDDDWYWHGIGQGNWYSLIWVLLGPRMPWEPLRMPFTCGGGATLGSTATVEEIQAVKKQILKWRSPIAYPVKVILDFGDVPICGRRGLEMPFICGGSEDSPPAYCTWVIGKTMGDTVRTMPFVCGGFQV